MRGPVDPGGRCPARRAPSTGGPHAVVDARAGAEAGLGITEAPARARHEGADLVVETAAGSTRYVWAADGNSLWLGHLGDTWAFTQLRETIDRTGTVGLGTGRLTSPMPGTVLAVHVAPGESVETGQPLVVVEAMKMEHVVAASAPGTVREVLVKPGDRVVLDQPLAVVES